MRQNMRLSILFVRIKNHEMASLPFRDDTFYPTFFNYE